MCARGMRFCCCCYFCVLLVDKLSGLDKTNERTLKKGATQKFTYVPLRINAQKTLCATAQQEVYTKIMWKNKRNSLLLSVIQYFEL